MKKNIILLTGSDTYSIEKEVAKWTRTFSERHSDINIERVYLDSLKSDASSIRQNMLSGWLFVEKRLFVISGGNEKRDKTTDFVAFFTWLFSELPDDHFLLFYNLRERATEIIPLLRKIGDTKEFSWIYKSELWEKHFPQLETKIIQKVLREYGLIESVLEEWEKNTSMSHMIAGTLESLELLALSKSITDEDIMIAIGDSGSGKNFDLIDAITSLDTHKALEIFTKIKDNKNMYQFLSSFIWLLRSVIYAKYAAHHSIPTTRLKIHPYVLHKSINARISLVQITKLYHRMIATNIAYKSGKWMKDAELWHILEIELGIIWLKK